MQKSLEVLKRKNLLSPYEKIKEDMQNDERSREIFSPEGLFEINPKDQAQSGASLALTQSMQRADSGSCLSKLKRSETEPIRKEICQETAHNLLMPLKQKVGKRKNRSRAQGHL